MQDLLKGRGADDRIDPSGDIGQNARAHHPQTGVGEERQNDPAEKIVERVRIARADHLVVDRHDEDRHRERHEVRDEGNPEELQDEAPEALADDLTPAPAARGAPDLLGGLGVVTREVG